MRKAREKGVDVACFSEYCHTPQVYYNNILIINYSGIFMENIKETVKRLEEIIKTVGQPDIKK